MGDTIDRELAAGKVEQIAATIDGALAIYNAGWDGKEEIRAFVDNIGTVLEALRTLTHAIMNDIAGEDA